VLTIEQDFFLQNQKPIEIDALIMQDGADLSELKAKTFQPNNLMQTKQLIRAVNPPAYSRSLGLHQSMTLKDAKRLNGETEEAGCFGSSSKRRTSCHGLLSTDAGFMGAALRSGSSVDWAKRARRRRSAETDFRSELSQISLPTVIIHGDSDTSATIDPHGAKDGKPDFRQPAQSV
jgi:pimeloyl-ACP methyl ester carboxylesterase